MYHYLHHKCTNFLITSQKILIYLRYFLFVTSFLEIKISELVHVILQYLNLKVIAGTYIM